MTPLYAALNVQWAPKALYPQPRAYTQQKLTYLELMKALLDEGRRLERAPDEEGLVLGLQLRPARRRRDRRDAVLARGLRERRRPCGCWSRTAPTRTSRRRSRPDGRARATADAKTVEDVSGLPPVPVGGPGVTPLQAATGVGYGEGFAANSHRHAPSGMAAGRQVSRRRDRRRRERARSRGQHRAASCRGARRQRDDPLSRVEGRRRESGQPRGQTTADMANGPVQRIQPFPETLALLEKLGAKNNNKCKSC